jgi:hypothetical protein
MQALLIDMFAFTVGFGRTGFDALNRCWFSAISRSALLDVLKHADLLIPSVENRSERRLKMVGTSCRLVVRGRGSRRTSGS